MPFNTKAIESGRAQYAYQCVKNVAASAKSEEYKSHIKSFPMLIHVNGLAAALAFAEGKKKEGHYDSILNHLQGWFQKNVNGLWDNASDKNFIEYLIGLDSQEYRMATVEVMGLLQWLRRFADGLIDKKQ